MEENRTPSPPASLAYARNVIYGRENVSEVIFHKRVRVFYQGLQTRENKENHEAVNRVIFVFLECFENAREH